MSTVNMNKYTIISNAFFDTDEDSRQKTPRVNSLRLGPRYVAFRYDY